MTIEFYYCFCSSLGNRFGNGGVLFEELIFAVVQVLDFIFPLQTNKTFSGRALLAHIQGSSYTGGYMVACFP